MKYAQNLRKNEQYRKIKFPSEPDRSGSFSGELVWVEEDLALLRVALRLEIDVLVLQTRVEVVVVEFSAMRVAAEFLVVPQLGQSEIPFFKNKKKPLSNKRISL